MTERCPECGETRGQRGWFTYIEDGTEYEGRCPDSFHDISACIPTEAVDGEMAYYNEVDPPEAREDEPPNVRAVRSALHAAWRMLEELSEELDLSCEQALAVGEMADEAASRATEAEARIAELEEALGELAELAEKQSSHHNKRSIAARYDETREYHRGVRDGYKEMAQSLLAALQPTQEEPCRWCGNYAQARAFPGCEHCRPLDEERA